MSKICFITAIYGNYETSCKKFVEQTIDTDFICFTDNNNIINNGLSIDTTPYHLINKSKIDDDTFINSFCNNKHTFNIAKYYKQNFFNIPILKKYKAIVWLDGTIEITDKNTSKYIFDNIESYKIIGWSHDLRRGILKDEVKDSNFFRYTSTFWNNQKHPYQDVNQQYEEYLKDGYDEIFFKTIEKYKSNYNFGVWLTCFIAFLNNDKETEDFLNLWYLQTLKYTTQDQIGFPYVVQKTKFIPYTLPDNEIKGHCPQHHTDFYLKHDHGK